MKYKSKSKEEKQAEIKALIDDAQKKIHSYFESPDSIKEYLNFMSKFYNYSLNNCSLIENQFPGAMAVAPYKTWQEKGFQVNKGEKAIKILVPCKPTKRFENEAGEIKPVTKATAEEKVKIKNGTYEVVEGKMYFMKGNVFDISQTNAKAEDLPKIFPNKWIEGDVKDYKLLRKALENVAENIGVKIIEPLNELGAAKGVSYTNTKEVALNPRNSELQNVKTLVHELTHAKLHSIEKLDKYKPYEKEFQAELTAYTVCKYVGLDTSEYSINYLYSWTKDKTFDDEKQLLKEVQETSRQFISIIEDTLISEKENSIDKLKENNMNIERNLTMEDAFNTYREYDGREKYKTISKEKENEIEQMIKSHEKWVESNGLTGEKLVLDSENLNGFKFYECDLRYAEIKNCDLANCVFYADMSNSTFINNKISNTKWTGSDITNMNTDRGTKLSIKSTLENNKDHDVMLEKLKEKKNTKKKENEYTK